MPARPVLPVFMAFLAALLLTVAAQVYCWPFLTDDAYITLRYADRLATGAGMTFNDGEWVEGFSNPLWVMVLAVAAKLLPVGLPDLARGLGVLFAVAVPVGVWVCLQDLKVDRSWRFMLLAALLIQPGLQVYASLGMEVPLLTALLVWGVALTLKGLERPSGGGLVGAAVCFALAGICRPEGPLYGALWGLALAGLLWRRQGWQAGPRLVGLGVITALPAILYEAYRLQTYGQWLPNTAIAKANGTGLAGYEGWFGVLAAPLLLLATALLRFWLYPDLRRRLEGVVPPLLVAGAPALAGVIFTLYAGPDWMDFMRFLQPVLPLLVVMAGVLLVRGCGDMSPVLLQRMQLGLLGIMLLVSSVSAEPWLRSRNFASLLMKNEEPVVVARWIAAHFSGSHTLAAARLGAVAYFNPADRVWDFFGLTDRAQAQAVQASGMPAPVFASRIAGNPVLGRLPELVLIVRPPWRQPPDVYNAEELSVLGAHWRCLHRFPQGRWGSYDLWVRLDVPLPVPADCSF